MSRIKNLIAKAYSVPQNISFSELQTLCRYFGFELQNTRGSHYVYARTSAPPHIISIQKCKKMAKSYQVKQLIDWAQANGLIEES